MFIVRAVVSFALDIWNFDSFFDPFFWSQSSVSTNSNSAYSSLTVDPIPFAGPVLLFCINAGGGAILMPLGVTLLMGVAMEMGSENTA